MSQGDPIQDRPFFRQITQSGSFPGFLPAAQQEQKASQDQAQQAYENERVAPEAHREQADKRVRSIELPGAAFKKDLVEPGKEVVKTQRHKQENSGNQAN